MCAGEVLTSDEVVKRKGRADAKKAAEKAAKKTSSKFAKNKRVVATKVTQEEEDADVYGDKCTQAYTDTEANIWIGCDSCTCETINVHALHRC